jgi:hypothetical protein
MLVKEGNFSRKEVKGLPRPEERGVVTCQVREMKRTDSALNPIKGLQNGGLKDE